MQPDRADAVPWPIVSASKKPRRSEQAVDLALAVTALIVAAGAALIVVSLFVGVRAGIPALGLILFILGLVLAFEFGVRPVLRQERSPLAALRNGFRIITGWTTRMVRGK